MTKIEQIETTLPERLKPLVRHALDNTHVVHRDDDTTIVVVTDKLFVDDQNWGLPEIRPGTYIRNNDRGKWYRVMPKLGIIGKVLHQDVLTHLVD